MSILCVIARTSVRAITHFLHNMELLPVLIVFKNKKIILETEIVAMNKAGNENYKLLRLIPALVFAVFFITAAVFLTGCGAVDEAEMPENEAASISTPSAESEMPTPMPPLYPRRT